MEPGYILVQVQDHVPMSTVYTSAAPTESEQNSNQDIILEPLKSATPVPDMEEKENKENSKSENNWCRIDFYHYSDYIGSDTFGHEQRKVFIGPKPAKDTLDLTKFLDQSHDIGEVIGLISPGELLTLFHYHILSMRYHPYY